MVAEQAGIPAVAIVISDFLTSAKAAGRAAGFPELRIATYPGAVAVHPYDEMAANIRDIVFPQIVEHLTKTSGPSGDTVKAPSDIADDEMKIAFAGSFEEVNQYFYDQGWTDGLPIVPPTADRVAEFLRFTRRGADTDLGVLHPSMQQATVHSVAVNGVMAGCRPEYMPVLIAVVEAIADPRFHLEDAGSSAGWTPMITLNGPVIDALGFNCSTAVLRTGNQANTSVSRFLRLYLRNAAGFVPGTGDMATFGRPDFPVLAENESASPWEPLSVTRGFKPGQSVVTVNSVGLMSFQITVVAQGADNLLQNIAKKVQQVLLSGDGSIIQKGPEMAPQLVLAPVIAEAIAAGGYSKKDVQNFVFKHSMVTAREFDAWLRLQGIRSACACVEAGLLPKDFCRSTDPDRMLPLYHSPDELQVIVTGTSERNRFFVSQNVSRQGLATSKKIDFELPD